MNQEGQRFASRCTGLQRQATLAINGGAQSARHSLPMQAA
jgi:hypothetical protein